METLTLKHPLKISEKTTITQLKFRDYTQASDYLSFDKRGGVAQRIALIASLTGNDESVIERLRGVDYRRAEAIADKMMTADEDESNDESGNQGREKSDAESAIEKKL